MEENQAFGEFKSLLAGEPPELGPGPRAGVWPVKTIDAKLDELCETHKISGRSRNLIRGLVLLWHDHHEPAHAIAQDDPSADGSLLHAILHRREPDYGNAGYWFRRVGSHPGYHALAKGTIGLLSGSDQEALLARLVHNGEWDPHAFISECEEANSLADSDPRVSILRQIQAIESDALLENLVIQ